MEDLEHKEDGLRLILEVEYKLEDLQKYVKKSCLAEKCAFLEETNDVEKICEGFLALLKHDELNLDEVTTLFVAASMVFFMQPTADNLEYRMHFLHKSFRYVDTLHPMHIHVATDRLWEGLKSDGISFVFNLLTLCQHISAASETGRAVAICLMWAILGEITETDIEMHYFRGFSELLKMLQDIDEEMLQREESTQIVYILVKVVGFLLNSIVFAPNEDFKKAGYRACFTHSKRDLEKLKKWADQLSDALCVSVSKTNNAWDLRMTIKEFINANIRVILHDKIAELQQLSN